jgi:hypothetical protein
MVWRIDRLASVCVLLAEGSMGQGISLASTVEVGDLHGRAVLAGVGALVCNSRARLAVVVVVVVVVMSSCAVSSTSIALNAQHRSPSSYGSSAVWSCCTAQAGS